jgi:molybdate transport system permease protein
LSQMPPIKNTFDSTFDRAMLVPLVGYLLVIVALVGSVFSRITWEAVTVAFGDGALLSAIWLTIITSLISTALSAAVALPSAYVLSRRKFPAQMLVDTLLDMPIVLPPLVMGLSILIFFNTAVGRWIDRGIWDEGLFIFQPAGIVLVQFVIGCAIATRVVKAGFETLDPRYEEMAMSLGANRPQAFYKVVLPNILPSLVAGMVISWARIFGLFGPVLLVAGTMRGRTEIMPTTIFLEQSIGRIEVALVVGALMILMSVATIVAFKKLGGRGFLW